MALPQSREARLFYRAALQRFEDAKFLLEEQRTTGAVYLAGYGIECILKAVILSTVAEGLRKKMLASFRGALAHDYEWLRKLYLDNGGAAISKEVARHLARVSTWSTDMRYEPGTIKREDAEAFFDSANAIITWANGRM